MAIRRSPLLEGWLLGFSHSFGSLFRESCTFLGYLAHSGVKNTARNEICTGDSPPDALGNSPDMPGNPPDVLDSQADTLDEWPHVIGKLPPPDDYWTDRPDSGLRMADGAAALLDRVGDSRHQRASALDNPSHLIGSGVDTLDRTLLVHFLLNKRRHRSSFAGHGRFAD